jgi:pimeloyl-ACP methyl ester carboxylesterase
MLPRERTVLANGLSHHVVEWGDAHAPETFVLCHGFLDLAWGFAELGPLLAAAGYRVLAFDFRGHGESGRTPEGSYYHFPDYVLDMHELLPQLVDAPFHLLGHSMGGTASTMYAATHVTSIRTLSLLEGLGPSAEAPERALPRLQSWLESAVRARREGPAKLRDLDDAFARLSARHRRVAPAFLRLLAEKSTAPHPSGEGLCWRFDPVHRTFSPVSFDRARFLDCLSAITAPVLALQGEYGFRASDDAERIARLSKNTHAIVQGAGHMLHWTHPIDVGRLVAEHARARQ